LLFFSSAGGDLGNLYYEKAEESHVEESQEQIETPVPPEKGLVRGQVVEQDINLMQGAWLVIGEEDEIAPSCLVIAESPPFRIQILDRPPDGDGIARLGIGRIEEEVITLPGRIANGGKDEGAMPVVFYLSSIDGDLDHLRWKMTSWVFSRA